MMNDPYTLIVALDENGKAKGHVYIDDGQSYKVCASKRPSSYVFIWTVSKNHNRTIAVGKMGPNF